MNQEGTLRLSAVCLPSAGDEFELIRISKKEQVSSNVGNLRFTTKLTASEFVFLLFVGIRPESFIINIQLFKLQVLITTDVFCLKSKDLSSGFSPFKWLEQCCRNLEQIRSRNTTKTLVKLYIAFFNLQSFLLPCLKNLQQKKIPLCVISIFKMSVFCNKGVGSLFSGNTGNPQLLL